jgi:D-xylose transport system permease protein
MNSTDNDPRTEESQKPGGTIENIRRYLAEVNLGALPTIIGLLVIWLIFQLANNRFLSPLNLTNLMYQMAEMGVIAIGAVLILLLGEVDLSAGAVSGLAAGVMAALNVKFGVPGPIAVIVAILTGSAVGLLQGFWTTRFRIPSFILTLAGEVAWTGALLAVLGQTGTINLRDKFIVGLAGTFLKRDIPHGVLIGWIVGALFVIGFGFNRFWERRRRRDLGLRAGSLLVTLIQVILLAVIIATTLIVTNADRGLPSAMIFLLFLLVIFDFITHRTTFGRHIYAVGGNAEAARRASINVNSVRIIVFTLASTLAAFGGILGASRLIAANQSSGGGDLLLRVIAAAVLGGTSLFGGRGSVWSALLGALVIQSISNGMDLLALPSPIKFMITGAVLAIAVTIEAISRQRREAAGR